MMISPSESAGVKHADSSAVVGMPVRLLGGEVREVSRLEFFQLGQPEIAPQVEVDGAEILLTEEAEALDGRLRSQAEEISLDLKMARDLKMVGDEARAEARLEWEQELEERIVEERRVVLKACEEFVRERARYFAGVEAEVVKLALAIAARVLHRESTLDPLLLTGVVRVALEKVAEDSAMVLRVPVSTVEMWREVFVSSPESSLQVVGDERLSAGECVLDTNVGRVELGVSAQLEEIERGFFDLMQQRPA
jgi:flagellar assembly protein FliH